MQATIDIGYEQVFQLTWQLSPRDRERLAKEIVTAEPEPTPVDTESRPDLIVLEQGDGYRILQVPFPDTEEGRMRQKKQKQLQEKHRRNYPDVLGHPKCSREEWKRILSSAPTLSSEESHELEESMKNFRKEFNDAFECRRLGLVGSD